jgi:RNA polymerase sigma factor (sigma-70 family)
MTPGQRRELHDLMVRFADGERAAFRPLFDALWPVLLAVTSRALPGRADAEDAAQRAMLVLFRRIVELDRDRDGVAWAATIAAYEVMTFRRKVHRRREQAATDERLAELSDVAPRADDQLATAELRVAVRAAVGELPQRDQEALAVILDDGAVPSGETPRKRRVRAMERLRAVWRKNHG